LTTSLTTEASKGVVNSKGHCEENDEGRDFSEEPVRNRRNCASEHEPNDLKPNVGNKRRKKGLKRRLGPHPLQEATAPWTAIKVSSKHWASQLTFELSGRNREGAWAARRMMTQTASRPKCLAGGGPLERRVRQHFYSVSVMKTLLGSGL
jgi:hypothetical protein